MELALIKGSNWVNIVRGSGCSNQTWNSSHPNFPVDKIDPSNFGNQNSSVATSIDMAAQIWFHLQLDPAVQAVAKVLTDRLEQKNPHKVWLAIMLIREVPIHCTVLMLALFALNLDSNSRFSEDSPQTSYPLDADVFLYRSFRKL